MRRRQPEKFVSPVVTRSVASVLLAISLFVVYVALTSWQELGWWAVLIILGAISSTILEVTALVTGDSEWILLDLVLGH